MSNLLPTISFPSPPEVTEGSYNDMIFTQNARMGVPYAIELTGVSYKDVAVPVLIGVTRFPSPRKVIGVPTRCNNRNFVWKCIVSVPYRGEWGVLQNNEYQYQTDSEFPSPLEVNGGSYLTKKVKSLLSTLSFRPLSR